MTVQELRDWLGDRLPFAEVVFYDVDTSETLSVAFDQASPGATDLTDIYVPVFRLERL